MKIDKQLISFRYYAPLGESERTVEHIIWCFDGPAGTFGAKAEVLEPAEARDIIRRNAEETLKLYGGLA